LSYTTWYKADSEDGEWTLIAETTNSWILLTADLEGKFIKAEAMNRNTGKTLETDPAGPVGPAD
jgi:hypothetical protein